MNPSRETSEKGFFFSSAQPKAGKLDVRFQLTNRTLPSPPDTTKLFSAREKSPPGEGRGEGGKKKKRAGKKVADAIGFVFVIGIMYWYIQYLYQSRGLALLLVPVLYVPTKVDTKSRDFACLCHGTAFVSIRDRIDTARSEW